LPALKKEYEKARNIKDTENILVIIGNPPYNVNSKSDNNTITRMVKETYIPKDEANVKPVYNDYVKFIRFSQYKIANNKQGIIGIITDNSFLDNLTYYKMREQLLSQFDCIYILNLHGKSANKGGIPGDKNIFSITQGVCISFFIKNSNLQKHERGVFYYSILQNKALSCADKLYFLENTKLNDIKFTKLNPLETEKIFFKPSDLTYKKEYEKFINLNEIFNNPSLPIMSKKDYANNERIKWIAYQYGLKDLEEVRNEFITLSANELIKKYQISEKSDWNVVDAQKDLTGNSYNPQKIQFRIWDYRYTSLSKSIGFLARPSYEKIAKHFEYENIGLLFERGCQNVFNHIFVTDKYADFHIIGSGSYLAPLYWYNGGNGYAEIDFDGHKKYANFTQNFIKKYINKIDFHPTPEQILAYIYAVLHSPIYRSKYIEFLKTDFPAVPFTTDEKIFNEYAKPGKKLIDLHLLKKLPADKEIRVNYDFDNDFVVEKVSQNDNKLHLFTADNRTVTFEGVTSQVYNFEIGSYKPIDKWMKYRIKDKVLLSISDLQHLKNMIIALKNTVSTMQEIEKLGEKYLK
jgi:predicted helicase